MEMHVIWVREIIHIIDLTTGCRVATTTTTASVSVSGFSSACLLSTSNWMAGGFVKAHALEQLQYRLSDRLQD